MRRVLRLGVACVAVLLSVAQGQNMLYWPDPTWRAPEGLAERPNPLAQRPAAAAGGKKLFRRNCAECHDQNGNGLMKKHSANLQLPVVQQQSDGTLFWKITNGNTGRGMPSFSKLPELERWQLVLFLRTLRSTEKPQAGILTSGPNDSR
jgi:mono/diheme cytochrome c family protein